MDKGLKNIDAHIDGLERKALKLVNKLSILPETDLTALVRCYPQQPSLSADDILRVIKGQHLDYFSERLDNFLKIRLLSLGVITANLQPLAKLIYAVCLRQR